MSQCRANFGKLTQAWMLYTEDNRSELMPNPDGGDAGINANKSSWAGGWLDFSSKADNFNTSLVYQPAAVGAPTYSAKLPPYLSNAKVFRCPADTLTVLRSGKDMTRVRSVSLNTFMNGTSQNGILNSWSHGGVALRKTSDIVTPSPAKAFVLIEEHPDSINDPVFGLDMASSGPNGMMVDLPASWHEGGGFLSFADGHVEQWTWQDPRTLRPILKVNYPGASSSDADRKKSAATVPQ